MQEILDITKLCKICRALEDAELVKVKFVPSLRKNVSSSEPGFVDQTDSHLPIDVSLLPFCYGCGKLGVICPNCSCLKNDVKGCVSQVSAFKSSRKR